MYELYAGAAKRCISPLPDMLPLPQQHMNGTAAYTGVRRDIYVRALVLDNGVKRMAFVVQEMPDPMNDRELKAAIYELTGIPAEDVFYCATHNHCVSLPAQLDTEGCQKPDARVHYTQNDYQFAHHVLEQSAQAVAEACAALRPARYGYGTGSSYINVNREEQTPDGDFYIFGHNFEMPSDKTLAAMKFVDEEGKLLACLLNYPVHSNVSFRVMDDDGGLKINNDVCGEVASFVERAFEKDGTVCLWTMAAAADQTPMYTLFHEYLPDMTFCPGEMYNHFLPTFHWKLAEHLGQRQGVDAVHLLNSITRLKRVMKLQTNEQILFFPMARVEGYDGLDERNNRSENFHIVDVPEGKVRIAVKLITLGDVAIFGTGCEITTPIGLRLKSESPYKNLMVVTLYRERGAMSGYVVDKKGYELRTSTFYRNGIKDGMGEDGLVQALLDMSDELINQ